LKTSICAIIVSYNCDEKILLGIENIKNQVNHVLIIDNGSKKKSIEILKKVVSTNVEIIYNIDNMGIAYALNQGIKYAKNNDFEWVVTLDQDSIATKKMIKDMLNVYNSLNCIKKNEVVSIVPRHIEEKTYDEKQIISTDIEYEEILSDITSGNLLKVSIFDKVGYFDEKLFIDCVDNEFCLRLCKSEYKIIRVNSSILLHNLGDIKIKKLITKKATYTNHSFIRRYYITRNRYYVWSLYGRYFKQWVKNDKRAARKDLIMILLFEKNKLLKFKMIIKGYWDFKKNHFGKLNI
jgi:rhamnosyltransferase